MCTPMCRVCLGSGVRMRGVEDSQLLETYEKLTGAKLIAKDGMPSTLCYICASQLKICWRFSDAAQRSEKFLRELLQNDMKVSKETASSLNLGISQTLTFTTLESISYDGFTIDGSNDPMYKIAVKHEISEDYPKLETSSTEDLKLNIKTENNKDLRYYCCHVCQKTSMTKTELITHLKTHANEEDIETPLNTDEVDETYGRINQLKQNTHCKICNRIFSEPKALKLHTSIHTGAKPFVCDTCSQAFRLKQSLQNHITVYHKGEKKFVCDICNKSFFHKKGLIAHKKSPKCQSPIYKPYACKSCDLTFSDMNTLRLHKSTHKGERRFGCSRCDKAFTAKSILFNHVRQVHSVETPYSCHRCSKKFKQLSTLKIHMRIHTGEKKYSCEICQQTFVHYSSLKRHELRHKRGSELPEHDESPFCCDRCSKKFRSQGGLNAHLRTHTGEKPFCCDTCGKRFSQRGNLTLHMKIHFGVKSFACEICGKTFLLKCQLKLHYQVHSEKKPFACDRCEMTFTFKSAFKEHIRRRHTEVKAYACNKCGKSFDQDCALTAHLRRHAAERVYSCKECSKCCTSAENLRRHAAIHSEETPFKCDRCDKAFKIMRYLTQHQSSARCRAKLRGGSVSVTA